MKTYHLNDIAVFSITWLTQTGEEATVTGTPTITIKKYNDVTNVWDTVTSATNMTNDTGSSWFYEYDTSTGIVDTNYRVYYNAVVDALNVEASEDFRIIQTPASQADIRELRKGNQRLAFSIATVAVAARNVEVGTLDYMTIYTKADTSSDWSSPTSTKILYAWYDVGGNLIDFKESN